MRAQVDCPMVFVSRRLSILKIAHGACIIRLNALSLEILYDFLRDMLEYTIYVDACLCACLEKAQAMLIS